MANTAVSISLLLLLFSVSARAAGCLDFGLEDGVLGCVVSGTWFLNSSMPPVLVNQSLTILPDAAIVATWYPTTVGSPIGQPLSALVVVAGTLSLNGNLTAIFTAGIAPNTGSIPLFAVTTSNVAGSFATFTTQYSDPCLVLNAITPTETGTTVSLSVITTDTCCCNHGRNIGIALGVIFGVVLLIALCIVVSRLYFPKFARSVGWLSEGQLLG